jgi:MFS family permease
MDRLPATATIWKFVVLISLGGFFEFYELFSTASVVPGIVRSGLLQETTSAFFGLDGIASYIAATFTGLFLGTFVFGFIADKCGRRAIFAYSMLWYSACAVGTALQTDALGLNLWRLLTGIGLGVELVTIDAYLSELVPPRIGGRAFALNQVITYSAVPAVALLSSILVPQTFMGMEGWRLVMVTGATGALAVWVIRLGLPESPRWLATHGRIERANAIVDWLEQRVAREDRGRLEAPVLHPVSLVNGSFDELWSSKYRTRTIMLLLFRAAQSVGLYGFSSWVPTFLIHQGVELAHSLQYTLIIAFMTPVGPVLAMGFADRFERKISDRGGCYPCWSGRSCVLPGPSRACHRPVRLSGYAWRHRDFTQLPCLSVRALSHPHPGARGRLCRFGKPHFGHLQRLSYLLCTAARRRTGSAGIGRWLHGRRRALGRPARSQDARTIARSHLFHVTSVSGIFGAVAAVAKLRALDRKQIADAFGLALSKASGSMQYLENGS